MPDCRDLHSAELVENDDEVEEIKMTVDVKKRKEKEYK